MIGIKDLIIVAMISFIVVMVIGPILIPALQKFKFGQTVRDDGPQTHLSKTGTPTMGGVMIMIAMVIPILIKGGMNRVSLITMLCMLGFGLIGFIDDFIKIKMTRSLGLTAKQKILLQVILALIVIYLQYKQSSNVIIPFVSKEINLGILYFPIMMIAVIGTVNAVNLTDGLDGLASGITAIVSLFFIVISLFIIKDFNSNIFAAALLGSCIGFLWFNVNPAKVFMGDTGSMALGGAVAGLALVTKSMFFIPIIGGIYFAEALSVIIQVMYFKKTRKRIFKMAPLHHHYEQCGWPETKVVFKFWIVAVILVMIGLLLIF